ncbi:MAG: virulence factor SrfB, partial [Rhodospirillaceae bacterium]
MKPAREVTVAASELKEVLDLVPNSGIQFVEYAFHLDRVPRLNRPFVEREYPNERDPRTGEVPVRLLAGWDEANPDSTDTTISSEYGDRLYALNAVRALEPFLGKWVPVPYVAHPRLDQIGGRPAYRNGPTNWARVRVIQEPASEGAAVTHRAVFAFDTAIDEGDPAPTFTTPSRRHLGQSWEFSFVSKFGDLHWFVHNPDGDDGAQDHGLWMREWVERLFQELKHVQRRGRPPRPDEDQGRLESLARYFVFLETLNKAVAPRKVRFVEAQATDRPVEVDLVLDIGNSRTYGILIERIPNKDRVDLKDSYTLKLRDLQAPERQYVGAFESHVELHAAAFGDEDLSRLSGRSSAFFWPSAVRVGPEASGIRERQEGTEAYSGLSSPKRYLWDLRPVQQEWRFPKMQYTGDQPPRIGRRLANLVNSNGDSLRQLQLNERLFKRVYGALGRDARRPATAMHFSRSSMYGLMVAEVVWQAMTMINNPVARSDRQLAELPRRLSRIILTLPSATPVREQLLMKLRAEGAIQLLWDLMGWPNGDARFPQPIVQASWDEASCVQLVWLYGEIASKSGGRIDDFFELAGRPRKRAGPEDKPGDRVPDEPSLRVATIDVGGGTTDLMITTYYVDGGRALLPVQNFREGMRIAGDDILRAVIQRIVLPSIERAMKAAGFERPEVTLRALFGGDRTDLREQDRHLRRQFVLRVLRPVGLGLLQAYEEVEEADQVQSGARRFASFFGDGSAMSDEQLGIDSRILNYLKGRGSSPAALSLVDIEVPLDFAGIAEATRGVLDRVFDNICEAVHHFDCDVVLLSGRPSRLPAVADLLIDKLAVAPHKIVQMHLYRPGRWYPLPDHVHEDRIGDPKTAAAVGGMLCALSERDLQNFMLYTHKLQMRSIANFVGQLESDGQLLDKRVLFKTADLGEAQSADDEQAFDFYTKSRLGYRQLPWERWVASPLYQVWLE